MIIPKVKPQHPGGICQNAMIAAMHGEIPIAEASRIVAHNISTTLHEHEGRPYAPMSADVFTYCSSRSTGSIARDTEKALKNATWLSITHSLLLHNRKEIELLKWAGTLCKDIDAVKRISEKAFLLEEIIFPESEYSLGLRVQEMDSNDRRRESFR